MMLKAPLPYQGSKRRELKKIHEHAPDEFDVMVDVFGGGGSVFLSFCQAYNTHYNDINPHLSTLFEILQSGKKTDALQAKINKWKGTVEEFHEMRKRDDLEAWLYCMKNSFRGLANSGTPNMTKEKKTGKLKYKFRTYKLSHFRGELKNTEFTHETYQKIFEKYKDNTEAFLYLDPPYVSKKINDYGCSFTISDVENIIKFMKDEKTKCKVMLHIDYVGYTRENLGDLVVLAYPFNYSMGTQNKNIYGKWHLIACNYKN